MNIIGFDVSKDELVGVGINKRGDVREKYVVKNDPESINQFLDSVPDKVTVGCESTSEYHNVLAISCIDHNIPCYVLNPIVTKQFTKATVRKRKTDLSDAHVIAKCVLQGQGERVFRECFNPAKRILRTSAQLSQLSVVIGHMKLGFENHWSKELEIQQELDSLKLRIDQTVKNVRNLGIGRSDRSLVELVSSIPGIGENLAAIFVSEIGNIERFRNIKALTAFAGLDPRIRQSGVTLARNTRLTKRGSPYLRRALFIAASIAQRYDEFFKAYYAKKRLEGKRYTEATIANARHILQRIYAVWKRGTPYVIHSSV
jgi:transposase